MFESSLQGKSEEVFICLQNGIYMADICKALADTYDVELHQGRETGSVSVIVIKKIKK